MSYKYRDACRQTEKSKRSASVSDVSCEGDQRCKARAFVIAGSRPVLEDNEPTRYDASRGLLFDDASAAATRYAAKRSPLHLFRRNCTIGTRGRVLPLSLRMDQKLSTMRYDGAQPTAMSVTTRMTTAAAA